LGDAVAAREVVLAKQSLKGVALSAGGREEEEEEEEERQARRQGPAIGSDDGMPVLADSSGDRPGDAVQDPEHMR